MAQQRCSGSICHHDLRTGVGGHVAQSVGRVVGVERQVRSTGRHRRQHRCDELDAPLHGDPDDVAALNLKGSQPDCKLLDALDELAEGHGPSARPKRNMVGQA